MGYKPGMDTGLAAKVCTVLNPVSDKRTPFSFSRTRSGFCPRVRLFQSHCGVSSGEGKGLSRRSLTSEGWVLRAWQRKPASTKGPPESLKLTLSAGRLLTVLNVATWEPCWPLQAQCRKHRQGGRPEPVVPLPGAETSVRRGWSVVPARLQEVLETSMLCNNSVACSPSDTMLSSQQPDVPWMTLTLNLLESVMQVSAPIPAFKFASHSPCC